MKIFLIIILMYQGEQVEVRTMYGPPESTIGDCQRVAAQYKNTVLPEGYTVNVQCIDRRGRA